MIGTGGLISVVFLLSYTSSHTVN